jgi:hypothetical protein
MLVPSCVLAVPPSSLLLFILAFYFFNGVLEVAKAGHP